MQKTTMMKNEQAQKNRVWYSIDATGIVLGKLAVACADLLRGKNKTLFTPHIDCGDYVIVRNARLIKLTGNKLEDKKYYSHSGYIGGLRTRQAKVMIDKYPEEMIYLAVKNMIPKNRLGRKIITKLHVYGDEGVSHKAQSPIEYKIK